MNEVINRLLILLSPVAQKSERDHQHWVHGDDEGIDYCGNCAQEVAAKLQKKYPGREIFSDGGWGYFESDGSATCSECGAGLTYTLLEYGVLSEFDHFKRYRKLDLRNPDLAFELEAIFEQFPCMKLTRGMKSWTKRIAAMAETQLADTEAKR